MLSKSRSVISISLIAITILLGIWIQGHIFLNGDTSWLLHAGERLLQGGDYLHDFFEVNTPMAIFVYLPAVLLTKFTHLSFIITLPVYVFFLASLSLVFCTILSTKIFKAKQTGTAKYFLVALAFVFILLPASQFGQREHLLVLLATPYLLLTVMRVAGTSCNQLLTLLIGLLAGVGFVIKPYFILLWLADELYLLYKNKTILFYDFMALLRPEFFAVIFVFILYGIAILLITPEYVTQVLPVILRFYYFISSYTWAAVLTRPLIIFSLLVFIFYLMARKQFSDKQVADIFAVAIVPGLLIYILQRTIFYYHLLPALSFASLLLFLMLNEALSNIILPAISSLKSKVGKVVILSCAIFTMLLVPITTTYEQTLHAFDSQKRAERNALIKMVNQYANGGPVYFFTDQISDIYPVVDYAGVNSACRFPGLWLVDSVYAFEQLDLDQEQRILLTNTKNFLFKVVWEDLQHYQPKLIFVQRQGPGWDYYHIKVDFIDFFNHDPRFASFWQGYSYLGKVGVYDVYKKI